MKIANDVLISSVGYVTFGVLSIVAIIYIVKFSIEIDKENYRKQMISNAHKSPSMNSMNSNMRCSPNTSQNSSFTTSQTDYKHNVVNRPSYINNGSSSTLNIPPRQITAPSSPNSIQSNINQYGNYMPSNNFRNSISYNNRQSRQYLLQNY